MYEVIFDEQAIDFLQKLPQEIRERIFKKIIATKESPFHFFERLTGRTDYKLRVGDYRIIADLDPGNNTIKITLIGHRKNIYKNLD
ncbi:MAG TPA: type II toxin-antitoxin system RelE/ParE family toxin [Candidatus Nanoarchaeia archaeon]|nr:type II toxin-antitoxin system RelE/ParE family toxin [Candidatus Nanoarchaeia archaeon]